MQKRKRARESAHDGESELALAEAVEGSQPATAHGPRAGSVAAMRARPHEYTLTPPLTGKVRALSATATGHFYS